MNKYKWYINRISRMTFPDLVYRIIWKFKQDFYYRLLANKPPKDFFKEGVHLNEAYGWFKHTCPFWFLVKNARDLKSIYSSQLPNNKKSLIKEANALLKRNFGVYDASIIFEGQIDWHKDAKTKKSWPKIYQGDLYINSNRYGGVLYVWAYNRFAFLYKLGAAYLITKDEKYAKEIIYLINSWVDQNPYLIGINWFSPLEMSIRVIAWIWALNMIKGSPHINKKLFSRVMQSIYLQMDYVYHNVSKYSSANNHLIGEAAGLVFVGSLLPFLKDSDKFKRKGLKILEEEIPKQILEDGVGAEQATAYLAFIVDFCVQAYFVAKNEMPQLVKKRLLKVAFFMSELINDRKQIRLIGDSNNGIVTGFTSFEKNFSSLIGLLMLILKEARLKPKSSFDDKIFWIYGPSAKKAYDSYSIKKKSNKTAIYKIGGYAFLRNPKNKSEMVFDFGPMGYLSLAAHGHADMLNVTLSVGNTEFIIDPGTYLAHSGGDWRDYFKSTHAHNTVVINGKNQAKSLGISIWDSNPRAKLIYAKLSKKKDSIVAKHDAFKKIGVTHLRKVINDKANNKFVIKDILKTCNKTHKYTIFFHLHPEVNIKNIGDNMFELKCENKKIRIVFASYVDISIIHGQENPILGWYSASFGFKEKTNVISIKSTGNENTTEIFIVK